MAKFIQVNIGIVSLLAIFYTYNSLIKSFENTKIFLMMYGISLCIYYLSQLILGHFNLLKKRPFLQITLLYLTGIMLGLLITCFSNGFTLNSVMTAFKINLLASPLFVMVLLYWRRMTKEINTDLSELKDYLADLEEE